MKNKLISFIHNPKQVIISSLVVALAIGSFGYININRKPTGLLSKTDLNISQNIDNTTSSQNITLAFLSAGRIKSVSVKAGDKVRKGQLLASLDAENALGALAQAQAAYTTAKANYQKVVNGATGTTVDVAKAAVNTAQVNLDGITKQQNILVANAHANLLNSNLVARIEGDNSITPPTLSGTYSKDTEGTITLNVNPVGTSGYFTISGITSGTGVFSTTAPQPIGDTGLFIQFPATSSYSGTTWDISIPNKTASNYLTNYNAYQSALTTRSQAISSAQALLDQAKASLVSVVSSARPEDLAIAQAQVDNAYGALQIAQASYSNTIITAPSDGTVDSVSISPGQIAMPNTPAIEFTSSSSSN